MPNAVDVTTPSDLEIVMTRAFDAPRELVFECHTRPELVRRWWSGGEGRPVLFLHPGDGFDPAAPFVGGLARRSRVIAPSHPGFGGSDLPTGFGTVDDLSYFYLDLMRSEWLPLLAVVVVSTALTLAVSALAFTAVTRRGRSGDTGA